MSKITHMATVDVKGLDTGEEVTTDDLLLGS